MSQKRSRKLDFQFFRVVFLGILLVASVFGGLFYRLEMNRFNLGMTNIELLLDASVSQQAGSIGNLLFFQNLEGMSLTLDRLSDYYGIVCADVYDLEKKLYFSQQIISSPDEIESVPQNDTDYLLERSSVDGIPILVYTISLKAVGEINGYLRVYYDISAPVSQMRTSVSLLTALFLSLLILLLVLIRYLTQKYITNPLTYLSQVMLQMSDGKLGLQADIRQDNEIGIITGVFNKMSSENASMYEKLEEINQSLEKQVIKRTKELRRSRSLLESVLNSSHDGIMVLKSVMGDNEIVDFEWVLLNPQATSVFVNEVSTIVGKNILTQNPSIAQEELYNDFLEVARTGQSVEREYYFEIEKLRGWYQFGIVAIEEGISVTFRNITKRKLLEISLEKKAHQDGLTGLANRGHFMDKLENEWQSAVKLNQKMALIFLDVDFFKKYNDTYGHQAGDMCLQQISQILEVRSSRPRDLAARYGGEEFVILLPCTDFKGASRIAENILEDVRDQKIPHSSSEIAEIVTVSMGISVITPGEQSDKESLIREADSALYAAKNNGRNCIC